MRRTSGILSLVALGIVTAFSARVLPRYRRDIRQARRLLSTRSRIAETRCGPIEYAVIGEGPPVLVVHGAGGGFDQGLDLGAPLAACGFKVIAPSRFGYLGTPLPVDASAAAQADAHASLLDALNIPRAAIVGFSAGAPSSMQLPLRHPDRATALVLVVPAAYGPRAEGAPSLRAPAATQRILTMALRSDFLFWAMIEYARSTLIESILGTSFPVVQRASADERARVDRTLRHILPVTVRRLGLLNDAAIVTSLERYPLERIAVPTLVASAVDDSYGTLDGARYTAGQIAGARFVEFTEGGHLLVGHQQALLAEITALLGQGAAARARAPTLAPVL
jgi:pimeloyl-ACP methyl ester carboxylesterase